MDNYWVFRLKNRSKIIKFYLIKFINVQSKKLGFSIKILGIKVFIKTGNKSPKIKIKISK